LLPAAVASATYDAANEQTAFAGATLTYDANGNLTNDGTNTYVWDARNRLVSITGGTTASFHYDVLGRRVHKTRSTPSPALSTGFLYDGNDIAAEIGGSAVGASYLRSLNIDEPFVRQAGTGNEFYHTDALGSSLVLSNSQGATGTMYTYEPFGKTTITGTSANAFQYTGRENDGTGLVYYRTRYYSPYMHRFTREDPIGFSAGPNFYTYVSNRPTQFIDPWGLDPRSKIGFTWGYTWGTNGQQCTFSLACKPTTTFPPAFQLTPIQISYNQPPPHLNPLNVNVNIYNHPIKINGSQPIAGFGVGASVGTYIYENQNPGPGGQTFQQQGFTLGVDIGIAPIVSISR
jgi:RHS repeat-associated protein